jgi:hypothetical protein
MKKNGKRKNGKKPKGCSCSQTPSVTTADHLLMCRIMRMIQRMEPWNIGTSQMPSQRASPVIMVVIPGATSAPSVINCGRRFGMSLAGIAIAKEMFRASEHHKKRVELLKMLCKEGNIENTIREKQSIPKPESGYRCAYPGGFCLVTDHYHQKPCPENCGECSGCIKI